MTIPATWVLRFSWDKWIGFVKCPLVPSGGNVFCRRTRSQSCPFCRDSLRRVSSGDLWVFTDGRDIVDIATVTQENLRRLFLYIDKLPLIVPESVFDSYDSHVRWWAPEFSRYGWSVLHSIPVYMVCVCRSVGCPTFYEEAVSIYSEPALLINQWILQIVFSNTCKYSSVQLETSDI